MSRRPTRRDDNIVDGAMFLRIGITAVYMSAVFLSQYIFNFLGVPESEMTTVLFTMFVLFQLFNAYNCRELGCGTVFRHILKNKLMLLVVGCTFVLQILIIQFGGAFFGTVPLGLTMWLKLFGIGASVVALSEAVKLVIRCSRRRRD